MQDACLVCCGRLHLPGAAPRTHTLLLLTACLGLCCTWGQLLIPGASSISKAAARCFGGSGPCCAGASSYLTQLGCRQLPASSMHLLALRLPYNSDQQPCWVPFHRQLLHACAPRNRCRSCQVCCNCASSRPDYFALATVWLGGMAASQQWQQQLLVGKVVRCAWLSACPAGHSRLCSKHWLLWRYSWTYSRG